MGRAYRVGLAISNEIWGVAYIFQDMEDPQEVHT